MGSYNQCVMSGFICRLCSELHNNVIHIYSEKGFTLKLLEKVQLMPIIIEPRDSLPKTICNACITQLECQYQLKKQLERSNAIILERARLHAERNATAESVPDTDCRSGDENDDNSLNNLS